MKKLLLVLLLLLLLAAPAFAQSPIGPVQYQAVPACLDTGGQHLNYNLSTATFLCGNIQQRRRWRRYVAYVLRHNHYVEQLGAVFVVGVAYRSDQWSALVHPGDGQSHWFGCGNERHDRCWHLQVGRIGIFLRLAV